jgi:PAT family beta-lactamase induction signal transducer AmpG
MKSNIKFPRYALFSSLYFSQGAIMSFFTALNVLYLQSFGLELSKIGVIGTIAMVPFVLKIFLGLLSDKINFAGLGYRKPYIVIGLIIQSGCLVFVPRIDPGNSFWQYAFLAFLMMTGMALYDTCTDGLALDTTPKEEEGIIQGFMVGGRAAGMVIVSALLGVIAQKVSWHASFYLLAVITLIPLLFISHVKEVKRDKYQKFEWGAFGKFRELPVILLAILGALYSLIINGANQLINPYLVQRFSINLSSAGFVATAIGLGIIAGSVMGGTITDKIGQRRSVIYAIVVSLIATLFLAGVNRVWMIWLFVSIFGFSFGFYETVYFAIAMNLSDRRIAATMFSILMAVANIGTGIGLGLTGLMADRFGFTASFIVIAGLNLLAIPLISVIFPKNPKFPNN